VSRTLPPVLLAFLAATALFAVAAAGADEQEPPAQPDTFLGRDVYGWASIAMAREAELERERARRHAVRRLANRRLHALGKLRRSLRRQVALGGAWGVTRGLLCIREHEGSWSDPAPPFWGGMQMDLSFQRGYGGAFLRALGTADRWPPYVQLAVALEAYYSGRGFGPWPTTRRLCGV
jgi:hypothetical protein